MGNTGKSNKGKRNKPASERGKNEASDNDFPGYPHYPASEDILNPANGARQIPGDPDKIDRSNPFAQEEVFLPAEPMQPVHDDEDMEDDLRIVSGTEADVTKDDLVSLGPRDKDMDMGDDELLKGKVPELGEAVDAIDVPGGELDDREEAVGAEDEENNYYSLGGDRQENLEEDNDE
jgi:hypothetical protein